MNGQHVGFSRTSPILFDICVVCPFSQKEGQLGISGFCLQKPRPGHAIAQIGCFHSEVGDKYNKYMAMTSLCTSLFVFVSLFLFSLSLKKCTHVWA